MSALSADPSHTRCDSTEASSPLKTSKQQPKKRGPKGAKQASSASKDSQAAADGPVDRVSGRLQQIQETAG
jgi:hypothetical protein